MQKHVVLGRRHFDWQLNTMVARWILEEPGGLLLRHENVAIIFEIDDSQLVALLNFVFIFEGHGTMSE